LQLLGVFAYREKYPTGVPSPGLVLPDTLPPGAAGSARQFPETGHAVSGLFLDYWQAHGGLAQQGYPISDMFRERSDLDGKTYTVQYFERSVLEYHPENKAPYNVLLSQLGATRFRSKYPSMPAASPTPGASGDVWAQLAGRPLKLPALNPTGKCAANAGKTVSPDYGSALGDGPVYAVGIRPDGRLDLAGSLRDAGGYYTKVLWVAQPGYNAPVLVRGAQLPGSGTAIIRFGDGTSPSDQLRLDPDSASTSAAGWHEWPTHTRMAGTGCYAYQLDSPDFSQVIVFWAIMTMP
jgi:hypothetical protein